MVTKLATGVKLQPMEDRVVVRPTKGEDVTKGGIVLPDTAQEKPQEGVIIAVGPGKLSPEGKRIEMGLKKGDKVLFSKYGGTEIEVVDEELLILRESDILAKIS